MTECIGVKVIDAHPMTRQAYNDLRGWQLPAYENGSDAGYISWSPKDVFNAAYRSAEGVTQKLTFGDALYFLKQGKRVARANWNGKGMWLEIHLEQGFEAVTAEGSAYPILDWVGMKTADNKFVPWLCSQTDMLSCDWRVLP